MKLPKPDESNYVAPPAGLQPAVCTGIIDLGTQKVTFQGQEKQQRKIRILFELLDEKQADGRPFTISKKYTLSMSDRANLKADLEGWRGRPFTPDDFDKFDMRNLITVACTLNIVKRAGAEPGREITFVENVMTRMKGRNLKETPVSETTYFSLDEFDATAFGKLHEKTQEMIKTTPEYLHVTGKAKAAGGDPRDADDDDGFGHQNTAASNNSTGSHSTRAKDIDDEIPF